MGSDHSSEGSSNFNPQQWQQVHQGPHGTVLANRANPNERIQSHSIALSDNEHMQLAEDLYRLRYNDPELVATRLIDIQKRDQMCSKSYAGTIYTEHIPIRLSNIFHVPFPDVLHLYSQSFNGLNRLASKVGPFRVTEDCIGVNEQHVAKVWHNPNFAEVIPSFHADNEYQMVQNIVGIIEANTDPSSMPAQQPSFGQYMFRDNQRVGFGQAKQRLQQYANRFNGGVIPRYLRCVEQAGGASQIHRKWSETNQDVLLNSNNQQNQQLLQSSHQLGSTVTSNQVPPLNFNQSTYIVGSQPNNNYDGTRTGQFYQSQTFVPVTRSRVEGNIRSTDRNITITQQANNFAVPRHSGSSQLVYRQPTPDFEYQTSTVVQKPLSVLVPSVTQQVVQPTQTVVQSGRQVVQPVSTVRPVPVARPAQVVAPVANTIVSPVRGPESIEFVRRNQTVQNVVTTGTVVQPRPVQTLVTGNVRSQVNVVPRPVVVSQPSVIQTGFQSPSRVVENVTIINRNQTQPAQANVNLVRNVQQQNSQQAVTNVVNVQNQAPRNVTIPVQAQTQVTQVVQNVTNQAQIQTQAARNVVTQQSTNAVVLNQSTQQQRQATTTVNQVNTQQQSQVPRPQNVQQQFTQQPQQPQQQNDKPAFVGQVLNWQVQQNVGQQSQEAQVKQGGQPSFVGQILNWQVQQNLNQQPQPAQPQQVGYPSLVGQVLNWQVQQNLPQAPTNIQQATQQVQQNLQVQQVNKLHTISESSQRHSPAHNQPTNLQLRANGSASSRYQQQRQSISPRGYPDNPQAGRSPKESDIPNESISEIPIRYENREQSINTSTRNFYSNLGGQDNSNFNSQMDFQTANEYSGIRQEEDQKANIYDYQYKRQVTTNAIGGYAGQPAQQPVQGGYDDRLAYFNNYARMEQPGQDLRGAPARQEQLAASEQYATSYNYSSKYEGTADYGPSYSFEAKREYREYQNGELTGGFRVSEKDSSATGYERRAENLGSGEFQRLEGRELKYSQVEEDGYNVQWDPEILADLQANVHKK